MMVVQQSCHLTTLDKVVVLRLPEDDLALTGADECRLKPQDLRSTAARSQRLIQSFEPETVSRWQYPARLACVGFEIRNASPII